MLQTFGRDGNDSSVGLPAERRKAIKAIEAISYQSYILINDMPKIDNLKRLFPHAYRQAPGTDHCTIASCSGFRSLAKL